MMTRTRPTNSGLIRLAFAIVLIATACEKQPSKLDNVDEGEGTYLNTKEWKYASFFNRVKQSVSQQWNPGQQLRLRDPTGNIYGGRDRYHA